MSVPTANLTKMMNDLEKKGYRFTIRHCRWIPIEDDCMTKAQYEKYIDIADTLDIPHPSYGRVISNNQGFTEVQIESVTGKIYTGKRNFGRKEQFNKRTGRVAALGKALSALFIAERP